MKCLTDLTLSKNRIVEIEPDAFDNLVSLVILDLSQNSLIRFESVPHSKSLDSLLLSYNRIDLICNLERAPNLTVVDLHSNKLSVFPEEIANLRKLKTLQVSNNDLGDLDPRLALLPHLVRLSVEGNPLKCIKTSVRNAGAEALKKYLRMRLSEAEVAKDEVQRNREDNFPVASSGYDAWDGFLREFVTSGTVLDLRNKNLNTISPKVWLTYPQLQTVDLSTNPLISSIPEEFGNLSALKQLRLSGCSLISLPLSLLKLKDLNSLEVNNNQLKSFFDEFPLTKDDIQLASLSYLSLNSNKLEAVPKCLKYIPSLRQLHMHQNRLSDLRELCQTQFACLEVVDVSSNKI